jgi:hypothetical protein
MPHTNKASAPVGIDTPELEGRYVNVGGYPVSSETYKADVDLRLGGPPRPGSRRTR